MLSALRRSSSWLTIAGLLGAAGCSKEGGERPQPSCTKWAPGTAAGPGDVALHFPLSQGNLWVMKVPGAPSGAWSSLEATGTRTVLGQEATILASFDLDTRAPLGESYRAVNDHGVLELGNDDASDTVTPMLVPYYSARFPLSVGDAFTSVQCSNLDWGKDLDGDGRNEFLDVELAVTVGAVEPIATELASFPEAARLEQRLTVTVRTSGFPPQHEKLEGLVTDWFVPGVGPVREVSEVPVGTQGPASELVGYTVGNVARGLLARRQVAAEMTGPYAWAFDGQSFVIAGRRWGRTAEPLRVMAARVTPGGGALAPAELITIPPSSTTELSPPALAAGGGVVAALASTWTGVGGDLLLQRLAPAGTLLEPAEGKVIGSAVSSWALGCGPALAFDGTAFLGVWVAPDGLRAVRIGADGNVLSEAAVDRWGCGVVAFDGTQYLVVYEYQSTEMPLPGTQQAWELRALHVGIDGAIVEAAPLLLSATPGIKHPIAMVFDGTQHVLLLADGRDGVSTALTLRRLSPAADWLDGDAATGGIILLTQWASMNHASLYGESVTLDGATPMVAWASGVNTLPTVPGEEAWVMRLGPDGAPLDLHGGLPGVDTYFGDPASCGGVSFPVALGGANGIPDVLYSVECGYPTFTQNLRAIRFGL